jgi:hypothetical protein
MFHQAGPAQQQAWLVALMVLLGVFFYDQVFQPLANYQDLDHRPYHGNDLKHLYLGSRLLIRGENPYPAANLHLEASRVRDPEMRRLNPYVYPPFAGYFFSWLTTFDYVTVKKIWYGMSQVLLFLSLVILWRMPSGYPALPWLVVIVGSVAFFFPLFRSITAGQLNHVLLFLLTLILTLWRKGYKKWAGIVIALATLIKVQPAFLLIWLGWKKEWGALFCAMFTLLILILLPAVQYGLNPWLDYLSILKEMSYGSSTWSDQGAAFYVDPGNIGFPALLYRLFTENPRTIPWLNLGSLPYLVCLCWAFLILGICLRSCRVRRRDEDPEMELSLWILGMLLIPSLFWDHYLVLAIPGWLLLLTRLPQSGLDETIMGLVAICWVWAGWKFFWFTPDSLSGIGILHLNATLPPVVVLFLVSAWLARNSHPRHSGGE